MWSRFPYVPLAELEAVRRTGACCMILHKDIASELERFLDLAGVPNAEARNELEESHSDASAAHLRQRWGPPSFEDAFVVAWRFDAP